MSEATNNILTPAEIAEALEQSVTPLHEMKGIRMEEMEAVYALAHDFYQAGRFEDAETLFRFLTMFDHLNVKYWMGYGAVEQVLKKWDNAIKAYALVCVTLDVHNVKASYYAAECHLARGDRANAISALDFVKEYAENNEMGREFRAKAEQLRARILANDQKEG